LSSSRSASFAWEKPGMTNARNAERGIDRNAESQRPECRNMKKS